MHTSASLPPFSLQLHPYTNIIVWCLFVGRLRHDRVLLNIKNIFSGIYFRARRWLLCFGRVGDLTIFAIWTLSKDRIWPNKEVLWDIFGISIFEFNETCLIIAALEHRQAAFAFVSESYYGFRWWFMRWSRFPSIRPYLVITASALEQLWRPI